MKSINERIQKIMDYYGFNKNSFSVKIGMTNNVAIGRLVSPSGGSPSYKVINMIIKAFPDINSKWLITGEGNMLVRRHDDLPEIKDRIMKIMAIYKFDFASLGGKMSVNPALIYNIIMEGKSLDEEFLNTLIKSFPDVNKDWIISNKGPLFLNEKIEKKYQLMDMDVAMVAEEPQSKYLGGERATVAEKYPKGFPYYELVTPDLLLNAIEGKVEPTYKMYIPQFSDCDFAIKVISEYMSPLYNPGDIVILKNAQKETIMYGDPYLVIADGVQAIKYINPAPNEDNIILSNENNKFPDNEIPLISIKHIYSVKGKLRREIS